MISWKTKLVQNLPALIESMKNGNKFSVVFKGKIDKYTLHPSFIHHNTSSDGPCRNDKLLEQAGYVDTARQKEWLSQFYEVRAGEWPEVDNLLPHAEQLKKIKLALLHLLLELKQKDPYLKVTLL